MTDCAAHASTTPVRARSACRSLAWHIVLCAASIAMLYPLLWMLASSFKPEDEIFSSASLWPSQLQPRGLLARLVRPAGELRPVLLQFGDRSRSLSSSATCSTCSLAAYAFARLKFRGRNFWFALMLGTLMLPLSRDPDPAICAVPQSRLGQHVPAAGGAEIPRRRRVLHLPADAVLPHHSARARRSRDDRRLRPWGIYWKIILPLSLPALATAAIFTFIWTWDDFFGPLVYLTDMQTTRCSSACAASWIRRGKSDWGALFAMSVLTLLPVFAFFLFFQRSLIEGITTTGLRG